VKDNGIGITTAMLPRVFEPFSQVDRSMERSEGGLGIGLTLVERLVALHNGTVHALSDGPGQGSTFMVRLPLPRDAPRKASGANGSEVSLPHRKRRILIVDDNRDAADSLAILLRMADHDVRTVHDGLEALDAATDFEPEVVLLDIGLPKLNGYEVARHIRELKGGRDRLLVAMTGWGQKEDHRRSREAGFDHHLTKPVEFSTLMNLLGGHMAWEIS
ncbi:MAG TPA: response regulator, partial [Candidatus Eisenbacteria bacterium]|nr:response regulator [Candidatus Eisenbacteria bacterium]